MTNITTTGTLLSHADRHALGVLARKQLARSAHAHFASSTCSHTPLDLLFASERGRIPSLLAIKHQRMAASAFSFFRGAVPIMAADLACHPNTGIATQICGDAHVSNLGAFGGAAMDSTKDGGSHFAFDISDFDESLRAPFEYDLKRLATSLLLAGREAGIRRTPRHQAVLHFLEQYRRRMAAFAVMPVLDLARYQIHRLAHIDPMPAILRQAERSTPQKSLARLTEPVPNPGTLSSSKAGVTSSSKPGAPSSARGLIARHGGLSSSQAGDNATRRFQTHKPLLVPLSASEREPVLASLGPYARTLQPERRHFLAQYTPQDVAFKVVGTGSVGLRDYCVYFEGSSIPGSPNHDPLFLQIKEETASAYAPYFPDGDSHTHQGHRVVDGQRAMQLTSDPFLGYTTIEGRDFLVRQLNDHKASLDLTTLTPAGLLGYADLCGELFARGHARAGDPVSISAYLGDSDRFDHAILAFARAYADKTEHDHALLKHHLKAGK